MNSYNTDIFFSNYYHWQSVRFELACSFVRYDRRTIIVHGINYQMRTSRYWWKKRILH